MVYFLEFKEIQGKKIKSVNLPEPVKSGISLKSTLDQDQRSLSVELQKSEVKENITVSISSKSNVLIEKNV